MRCDIWSQFCICKFWRHLLCIFKILDSLDFMTFPELISSSILACPLQMGGVPTLIKNSHRSFKPKSRCWLQAPKNIYTICKRLHFMTMMATMMMTMAMMMGESNWMSVLFRHRQINQEIGLQPWERSAQRSSTGAQLSKFLFLISLDSISDQCNVNVGPTPDIGIKCMINLNSGFFFPSRVQSKVKLGQV